MSDLADRLAKHDRVVRIPAPVLWPASASLPFQLALDDSDVPSPRKFIRAQSRDSDIPVTYDKTGRPFRNNKFPGGVSHFVGYCTWHLALHPFNCTRYLHLSNFQILSPIGPGLLLKMKIDI